MMSTLELPGWFLLVAPVLAGLGGLIGAALMQNWRPAREVAEPVSDYVQAVREAVEFAERYGATNHIPGAAKLAIAIKKMDDFFDSQGIHGDARKVTLERARADIELLRAKWYPSGQKAA